jgi:hypothetical protein
MTCTRCGYHYRIDPNQWQLGGKRIADGFVKAVLDAATAGGTRYATPDGVFTQASGILEAKRAKTARLGAIIAAILLAIGLLAMSPPAIVWVLVVPIAAFGLWRLARRAPKPLDRKQWDAVLNAWQEGGGDRSMVIDQPALQTPPPGWSEPDIYDYGFERLILTEDALTVDWLVRNGIHAQERALVLQEAGYPAYLVDRAQQALQANPALPVFLLHRHDTPPRAMEERIARDGRFPIEGHPVRSLGLNRQGLAKMPVPEQLKGSREPVAPHALPMGIFAGALTTALANELSLAQASSQLTHETTSSYG